TRHPWTLPENGKDRALWPQQGWLLDAKPAQQGVVLARDFTDGDPATVFIEVKYSEGMNGPVARHRPRYDEASRQVGLFRDPDAMVLRSTGLEQLWREHMMAQRAVDLGIVGQALFVAVGPQLNRRAQGAFKAYQVELANPEVDGDNSRVGFRAFSLERIIEAMAVAGAIGIANRLWDRYCAFDRVLAEAMGPPPSGPPLTDAAEK
ncbi:PGN_0703 family putative restriction endonuclease, partial [Phreatobacter sp. HK31-P]